MISFSTSLAKEVEKEIIDRQPFDYIGMCLFAIMIGSVTLFMTQGFERGWLSVFSVSCLVVFLISGIVFVLSVALLTTSVYHHIALIIVLLCAP